MTNKTTKSALLTSSISLLLCFAMLLGTTFAWFTDSVTSANNIIKSGNLDVTFEYWNGSGWTSVEEASDILTNELWEPGVTEVAYLKVANAGSLALKYQMGINIVSEIEGTNVAGDTFKLSDYIQFGVVENVNGATEAYADRADAVAAVSNADIISAGYTTESTIEAGAADQYFALVVWMPTTVGNEANHNGTAVPQIDLGINVVATQVANEDDSFDINYDEDATYDKEITIDLSKLSPELREQVKDMDPEELKKFIAEEKLEKPKISADFMTFWLHKFRQLDMTQEKHRQMLIDTFVNAIFVYDDKLLLTFNFKDSTRTISLADVQTATDGSGSDLEMFGVPKK